MDLCEILTGLGVDCIGWGLANLLDALHCLLAGIRKNFVAEGKQSIWLICCCSTVTQDLTHASWTKHSAYCQLPGLVREVQG